MNCLDIIRNGIGRDLTEDEAFDLFEEAQRLKKQVEATQQAANRRKGVQNAADKWADKKKRDLLAKKRAVYLDTQKRLEAFRFVTEIYKGREAEGLSVMQVGGQLARAGSRMSCDALGKSLEGQYIGGFMADLGQLGEAHVSIVKKKTMEREIARALHTIDNPNATPYAGPKEAMEIAQVMHKWQERARVDQNGAGAWISKENGYIIRQSHDQTKIRRGGEQAWTDYMMDNLDWTRTADGSIDYGGG